MAKINKMDKIFNYGILVQLKVTYWSGKKRLLPSDIGFKDEVPRELINLGQLNLMTENIRASIRRVESNARYYLKNISFPFPIGEAHFVPLNAIPELIKNFEMNQEEFTTVTSEFLRKYKSTKNKVLNAFRNKMPEIYKVTASEDDYEIFFNNFIERLELIYPDKKTIANTFRFDWNMYDISLPKVNKHKDQFYAQKAELNRKLESEYRRKAMIAMDDFLDDVVKELRAKTVEVCSFVITKISKGEVVTETNIQNLQNFIEKFSKLNFVDDTEIDAQLKELNTKYLNKGTQYYKDNKQATAKLNKQLKKITKSAEKISDVSDITGTWKRKITIK